MSEIEEPAQKGTSNSLMKYGMWACCAVMVVPVAVYFAAGGQTAGFTSNIFTFAPLLLCVGAHFVMHRFMGKSCHESSKDSEVGAQDTPLPITRSVAAE
jgi:hypothetical protein